jgi:hypothetical protein
MSQRSLFTRVVISCLAAGLLAFSPAGSLRAEPSIFDMSGEERMNYVFADVANAEQAMSQVTERLRALGPLDKIWVVDTVDWIVAHCPYNGAIVDLVATLDAELQRATPAWNGGALALDGATPLLAEATPLCVSDDGDCAGHRDLGQVVTRLQAEFEKLTAAVGAHVDLLDELGVSSAVSRTPLDMAFTIGGVQGKVAQLAPETMEELQERGEIAAAVTAEQWNSKPAFIRYGDSLKEIGSLGRELLAKVTGQTCCDCSQTLAERTRGLVVVADRLAVLVGQLISRYC